MPVLRWHLCMLLPGLLCGVPDAELMLLQALPVHQACPAWLARTAQAEQMGLQAPSERQVQTLSSYAFLALEPALHKMVVSAESPASAAALLSATGSSLSGSLTGRARPAIHADAAGLTRMLIDKCVLCRHPRSNWNTWS